MTSQEKYELSEEIKLQIRNLQSLYNKLHWYQFKKKKKLKEAINEMKQKLKEIPWEYGEYLECYFINFRKDFQDELQKHIISRKRVK